MAEETQFGFCEGAACTTASTGMIRSKIKVGGSVADWQPLTDDKVVRITSLIVTPINGPETKVVCPTLCAAPADSTECWPKHRVREAEITITGQAVSDPSVQRTLTSRVRLRNDMVALSAPGGFACPAP